MKYNINSDSLFINKSKLTTLKRFGFTSIDCFMMVLQSIPFSDLSARVRAISVTF